MELSGQGILSGMGSPEVISRAKLGKNSRVDAMKPRHNHILVVDDEAAMREVLRARLEQWGFEVTTAEDGVQAQSQVETHQPDMAISDLVLPDVSGLDLVKTLQTGDPDRPVVLITAYGTVDTAVEAM